MVVTAVTNPTISESFTLAVGLVALACAPKLAFAQRWSEGHAGGNGFHGDGGGRAAVAWVGSVVVAIPWLPTRELVAFVTGFSRHPSACDRSSYARSK